MSDGKGIHMSAKESKIPTGEKVIVFSLDFPTQLDLCVVVLRGHRESMCKKKRVKAGVVFSPGKEKKRGWGV